MKLKSRVELDGKGHETGQFDEIFHAVQWTVIMSPGEEEGFLKTVLGFSEVKERKQWSAEAKAAAGERMRQRFAEGKMSRNSGADHINKAVKAHKKQAHARNFEDIPVQKAEDDDDD